MDFLIVVNNIQKFGIVYYKNLKINKKQQKILKHQYISYKNKILFVVNLLNLFLDKM